MEVRIYDLHNATGRLRRIGLTNLATGHFVNSKYEAGPFEISVPLSAPFANEFLVDRIVLINRKSWGVITGKKTERAGADSLTVAGKELTEWLSRRQIVPAPAQQANMPIGYDSASGPTETIMKHYVNNHAVYPMNSSRKIQGLTIAPDLGRGIEDDAYHARYVELLKTLGEIGKRANLGMRITGNERTEEFIFDVIPRRDRTASQTENMPLILEMSRRNIDSLTYVNEVSDSGNVFYCSRAGDQYEWETLTQTYFLDDQEQTGYKRREKSLSISVYEEGDQYEQLEINSKKEMENYRPAESLSCVISRRLVYGKDYIIGDYVTVIDKETGIQTDMEITLVDTIERENGTDYVATFGTPQLTRVDAIRRDMKARL